jgi:DNA-binding transcriptional MerR regulator
MAKEEFIPADLVRKLAEEGKSESEIISQLRAQGFTPSQIDKALKEVGPSPARPAPPTGRPKETYRGPLPKEIIPPATRAARPEQRLPAPLEGAPIGRPPERIEIPEHLKPMEIGAPPARPRPAEKPATRPAKPAPLPRPMPARPDERKVRISLEELIEQVVAEHEKRMEEKLNKLHAEHDANMKKMESATDKIETIETSMKENKEAVDAQLASLKDAVSALEAKTSALETAFKGLSKFFKK